MKSDSGDPAEVTVYTVADSTGLNLPGYLARYYNSDGADAHDSPKWALRMSDVFKIAFLSELYSFKCLTL